MWKKKWDKMPWKTDDENIFIVEASFMLGVSPEVIMRWTRLKKIKLHQDKDILKGQPFYKRSELLLAKSEKRLLYYNRPI